MPRTATIALPLPRSRSWLARYGVRMVGLLLLGVIVWQLWSAEQLGAWWEELAAAWAIGEARWWLLATVLLMPLNWTLETIKWRSLLQCFTPVSWQACWRSVMAGISVSLATPNRIGEYGGRLLVRPEARAESIILSSLLGSVCQWMVFLLCGWPALVYWLSRQWEWGATWSWSAGMIGPIFVAGLLFFWRRRPQWQFKWIDKHRYGRWLRRKMALLRKIGLRQLATATFWAFCRYGIYVLQYYCLLRFFGLDLPLGVGVVGISAIFFIQAGVPLPPAWGVVTRSELALLMWGALVVHPIALVGASLSLFIVNLILPALLGTWWIVKINGSKTLINNENEIA